VTDVPQWADVESYLSTTVAGEDEVLAGIRARTVGAGLRPIELVLTSAWRW
jgi:hypothetical protein